MHALRLLNQELPVARPEDTVDRVLRLMDDFKVRQLPVVNGEEFSGLAYEADLLEYDGLTPMATMMHRPVFAEAHAHVFDLVSAMVEQSVDLLPVVKEGKFLGTVTRDSIFQFLHRDAQWGSKGGTIVLEMGLSDFSMAELSRRIESNGLRLVAFTTAVEEHGKKIEVTLKVNSEELGPLLDAFQRFGYQVKTFHNAPGMEEEMRDRYEAFMRYLDM